MNVVSVLAVLLVVAILGFAWWRKVAMTYALIAANVVVFLLTLFSAGGLEGGGSPLFDDLGFRPEYVLQGDWPRLYTTLTAAFLHAGLFHIAGNMVILFLAGMPFEQRLGRARYLALYLFTAFTASLVHAIWIRLLFPEDTAGLAVGASGAVFGILGGLATAYPSERIMVLLPIPMFLLFRRMPAVLAALMYAGIEFVALFFEFGGSASGVAHAAHFGGAIGGALVAPLLKRSVAKAPGGGRRAIDYDALSRLAQDEKTRQLVEKVRQNSDTPELQKAWLDRLLVALRCPRCGHGYAEVKPGILECDEGHRERYVV